MSNGNRPSLDYLLRIGVAHIEYSIGVMCNIMGASYFDVSILKIFGKII